MPFLLLPSAAQQAKLDELEAAIKAKETTLADVAVAPVQAEWEGSFADKLAPIDRDGLVAHYELDGNFSDISGRYQHGRTVIGDPTFDAGQIGRAVTFDGDTEVTFGNVGSFDRGDRFSLAVWLRGRGNQPMSVLQKIEDANRRRGYEWRLDDIVLVGIQRWAARMTIALASDTPGSRIEIRTRERLRLGDWYHVALTYDGSGKASGLFLYVDGKLFETDVIKNTLAGPIGTDAALKAGQQDPRSALRWADR